MTLNPTIGSLNPSKADDEAGGHFAFKSHYW